MVESHVNRISKNPGNNGNTKKFCVHVKIKDCPLRFIVTVCVMCHVMCV